MVDININLKVSGHEKLVEYVASGIGATAGPLFATWRASQEGEARVIAARADAVVQQIQAAQEGGTLQLIKKAQAEAREYLVTSDGLEPGGDIRVQEAMEFQAKKRLTNDRAIAGHAAEDLRDTEVPDHEPDPDWIARFFDSAQDVSSKELQKLWGKILAGEVKSPGQTSLRTLSILRDMTQQEAKDFSDLMRFRISSFVFQKGALRMLGDRLGYLAAHFCEIGLLCGTEICQNLILKENGKCVVEYCNHALIIEGAPGREIRMQMDHSYVITSAGLELSKLCRHELDLEYLAHFATFLETQDCRLRISRIIKYHNNAFEHYTSNIPIIKPFVEPEDRDQEELGNAE